MTKRDAWRTPQTSILARHEAGKTPQRLRDGMPVQAYATYRDGACGRGEGAETEAEKQRG